MLVPSPTKVKVLVVPTTIEPPTVALEVTAKPVPEALVKDAESTTVRGLPILTEFAVATSVVSDILMAYLLKFVAS